MSDDVTLDRIEEFLTEAPLFGYRILIRAPWVKEKTAGGVILGDQYRQSLSNVTYIGKVMQIGPVAYKDKDNSGNTVALPEGDWVKPGDWVYFSSFEAHADYVRGHKIYFANDLRALMGIPPKWHDFVLKDME